jgi:aryl-alcohol dehydrogenase-like predicted oxidoreductase
MWVPFGPAVGCVCVQNVYNLAHRNDDAFIDDLATQGIAYVPFFPLGGFSPLQSATLNSVAGLLGATPMQVALAWLLHRAPNILLIPGTSSLRHLRENLGAAELNLPNEAINQLNSVTNTDP